MAFASNLVFTSILVSHELSRSRTSLCESLPLILQIYSADLAYSSLTDGEDGLHDPANTHLSEDEHPHASSSRRLPLFVLPPLLLRIKLFSLGHFFSPVSKLEKFSATDLAKEIFLEDLRLAKAVEITNVAHTKVTLLLLLPLLLATQAQI